MGRSEGYGGQAASWYGDDLSLYMAVPVRVHQLEAGIVENGIFTWAAMCPAEIEGRKKEGRKKEVRRKKD